MSRIAFLRPLVAIVLAFAVAGCTTAPEPSEPGGLPTRPDADATSGARSPLPTRSGQGTPTGAATTTTAAAPAAEGLTDFEQAMAKTWRRYHVANKGYSNEYEYYEYLAFNEDRTACRWKYGQDSSTSLTDDVFSESDYTHWEISTEGSTGNYFRVVVQGSGLDYWFDFTKNRITPVDYDNLIFTPTTDGKSCFVRDGAGY